MWFFPKVHGYWVGWDVKEENNEVLLILSTVVGGNWGEVVVMLGFLDHR